MVRTCVKCGKAFRARSMKSMASKCYDCEPRRGNLHLQQKVRDDNMTVDAYKRLRDMEEKVSALELAFNIQEGEINTVVRDIEGYALILLEEAVEKKVEKIFDEKIQLVDSMEKKFTEKLAIVNSRISEAFEKAGEANPLIEEEPPEPQLPELSTLQKQRLERLEKFLKMQDNATKSEILEWAWQDVPKSSASPLLKTGIEYGYIELDGELAKEGRGRSKLLYKAKEFTAKDIILPSDSDPEDPTVKKLIEDGASYYGDDLRDF